VLAQGRAQGAPPLGAALPLNILVGDASEGRAFFGAKCSSCHSPSGDLQGIASRIADPTQLQNLWVAGETQEPRDPFRPVTDHDVIVIVTPPAGAPIEGRLEHVDDFSVSLLQRDGRRRSFRRAGEVPKVDIRDPLAGHKQLLQTYTDADIHNVTAYLVTLK
jgi:cytochrome c oxidase cbb3-type subunit 3